MEQALERAEQVQRALDQSLTTIALCDKELKDIRQILNKTIETGKGANQWIETLGRQVTESQTVIATYEEKFARTIPTEGLTEDALEILHVGSPLPMTEPILSASGKSRRPLPNVEKVRVA
jgi:hypothetical protein